MHLVGFIIRIYHDARSSECPNLSSPCWSISIKKERNFKSASAAFLSFSSISDWQSWTYLTCLWNCSLYGEYSVLSIVHATWRCVSANIRSCRPLCLTCKLPLRFSLVNFCNSSTDISIAFSSASSFSFITCKMRKENCVFFRIELCLRQVQCCGRNACC